MPIACLLDIAQPEIIGCQLMCDHVDDPAPPGRDIGADDCALVQGELS
jgi:hypothetical protein